MKILYTIIGIFAGIILGVGSTAHAVSYLFPYQGGTGTSTAPVYGQLLVGLASGVYQLQATSTLGITSTLSGGSSGNVAYWTSATALSNVATTTLTAGTNVTFTGTPGFLIGGTNLTINASGGGGSTVGQAWEIGGNGNTGFLAPTTTQRVWIGQASSTLFSSFGPAYFGATATSSFSTAGALTLTTPLLVGSGGTGVNTFTSSQLLYGNGTSALSSVATTSVTCSGNTTCTAFTAIGAAPITINSTGGGTGLSTTSPIASSNLLVYSTVGAGAAYGVATTSLSVSAPITFSGTLGAQVGGVTGSFGCTNASSGVTGCLTGTNWDTFNNKQATISATWPITLTGAAVGFNGLATSTAAVLGNIPYFSGVNTFANVATSTIGAGTGLSFSGTSGYQVGGTNGTFSVNTSQNIATLSNLTSNGFVKTSGGAGTLSVDTNTYLTGNQSITLSGDVSGSGTTAITTVLGLEKVFGRHLSTTTNAFANSEILTYVSATDDFEGKTCAEITGSADLCDGGDSIGSGSGTVSTSTSETSGFLPYWTTTSATPALLGATSTMYIASNGKLGIGTTTPNATLTINGSAYVMTETLSTSTSMTVDFCTTSNNAVMGVGNANIAFAWTNASVCKGKSILLSNYSPLTGAIGTTTFSGGSGSGAVIWNGGIDPGSTVVNGTTDDFCFTSTASTTSYIAASLCGQH